MARLKLEFHNVVYFDPNSSDIEVTKDISLSTDKEAATVCLAIEQGSSVKETYNLNLVDFKFKKKMYQPTEIIAKIQISLSNYENDKRDWKSVNKKVIEKLFSNKKVSLSSVIAGNQDDVVGDDYYVQDVKVNYKPDAMYATLGIYSLDKLMTLKVASQAFVSKKLAEDIIPTVLEDFKVPYDTSICIKDNTAHMNVLKFDGTEHIFPYLVQYNESIYDMLARTTNRWGEFMFYEDGALNFGYNKSQTAKAISGWADLEYCDLGSGLNSDQTDNTYDTEAAYAANVVDSPLPKDGDVVKNLVGCNKDNGMDVWIMKKVASFLGNSKNIPTWIGNQVFDDTYNRFLANKNSDTVNEDTYDTYFANETEKEKYGMHEFKDLGNRYAFNPFTELHTKFNQAKYRQILKNELEAAQGAVRINYDTTYPNLKLGQIIKVNGDEFIVNEIEAKFETVLDYSCQDGKVIVTKTLKLVFQVIALAKTTDKAFFPTVLPTGHVRYSGPQLAKVFDANDPLNQNRVRIYFPWQNLPEEPEDEEAAPVSTPWLVYATSAASKSNGIFGKHYKGDEVIVNFANGNIENPYVVGGLAMKGNKVPGSLAERDIVLSSPGGHTLRMDDGSGAGLTAFLAGAVFPGYELLTTFFPFTSGGDFTQFGPCPLDGKISRNFEGGFQLTDKYGIYTISGSTDERNVSIKSPWGDVSINAFTGISISAPNGDIEIKGKNVKIEAGNNLELVSGTNIGSDWRPHKETLKGGLAQVGTDIMAAVVKKLAEKIATIVDLSILRSMFEIVVRPIEGVTVVKSNRYLKLETGDDECDYPDSGYKETDMGAKKAAEKIREGLGLTVGVCGLIDKTKAIADDIDKDFRSRYNKCVKERKNFEKAIDDAKIYANNYSNTNNNAFVLVCKSLAQNLDPFWKALPYADMTEDELGFTDNYKVAGLDTHDTAVQKYWNGKNIAGLSPEEKERPVIDARTKHRRKILSAANSLRKAICKMLEFKELSQNEIVRKVGWNYGYTLFKDYKTIMKDAFSKSKLDESFYYKDFTDAQKKLVDELEESKTDNSKKALRRMAAVTLLEGLGFKDEWRDNHATKKAPRNETDAKKDTDWKNYAESLRAFPPLEAKELAVAKAFADPFTEAAEGFNPFKVLEENKVWNNSKHGSILYTYQGKTYSLGNTLNVEVDGATHKGTAEGKAEIISTVDNLLGDDRDNKDVKRALNEIMEKLKKL